MLLIFYYLNILCTFLQNDYHSNFVWSRKFFVLTVVFLFLCFYLRVKEHQEDCCDLPLRVYKNVRAYVEPDLWA